MEYGLIILSGGKSSRMGTDKAFVNLEGKPFIEHIIERGRECGFRSIMVVANQGEKYQYLGLPILSDIYPQLGPLSGIHAGLSFSDKEYNLVVPCDAPLINLDLLKQLFVYTDGQYKAIVPTMDGRFQPLMSVYHRDCIGVIEQMLLVEQEYKLSRLFERVNTKKVEMNFNQECFVNINTPQELAEIKECLVGK